MQRLRALQIGILIAVLLIVIPLAYSLRPITVTGTVTINSNTQKAIVFNLQDGQTITGSLDYYSEPNTHGMWYPIVDPYGNELNYTNSEEVIFGGEGQNGTFAFTAKVSGEWGIHIGNAYKPYGGTLFYSYTINTATILGVNPILLMGLVIAIGVSSELIILRQKGKCKSPLPL
jgi:hypothetical protein